MGHQSPYDLNHISTSSLSSQVQFRGFTSKRRGEGGHQTKINVPAHPVISVPFAFSSSLLILLYAVNVQLLSRRELFWHQLLFRQSPRLPAVCEDQRVQLDRWVGLSESIQDPLGRRRTR